MIRTVEVPEGSKVIIVSEQLLERYQDWARLPDLTEARVVATENAAVVDVLTRYVA